MLSNLFDLVQYLSIRMGREEGQTMAEYGILIGVIAVVVVAAAVILGSSITGIFTSASSQV
jgi:pilus assembly protein Flp/PilA